jgi:hypothetical protein
MSDNRHLDTPIVPQYPGIPREPLFPVEALDEDVSTLQPGTPPADRSHTDSVRRKIDESGAVPH